MSARTSILAIALATMAVPAAFAQTTSIFVGGEAGWVDRPVQSTVTREQVSNEFLTFRSNPVASDGGRYVGGQEGYAFAAHTYARVDGQWVCTDRIAHNPKPDAVKSSAERTQFLQQYPA